jgi:uncharacterized protein YecT (DUF1311 family)
MHQTNWKKNGTNKIANCSRAQAKCADTEFNLSYKTEAVLLSSLE